MFLHHVFFWMPPDATERDREQLRQGLLSLTTIRGIRQWHIGVPAGTNRAVIERSFALSWLLIFESAEAEILYQEHPVHLQFIQNCAHLWTRVVVYDAI